MRPTPYALQGGVVFYYEGFAAAPLPLALPGEPVFFACLPAAPLTTLALPGASEGKPHRGAALMEIKPPSWKGTWGGAAATL